MRAIGFPITCNYAVWILDSMDKGVGKRIKALRLARHLSGAALARQIGIAQPSLWELKNKPGAEPSGRVLAELCRALHTTCTYIIFGGDNGDPERESEVSEMLYLFRRISPESRTVLLNAARSLYNGPSLADPFRVTREEKTKQSP